MPSLWENKYARFRRYPDESEFYDRVADRFLPGRSGISIADLGCGVGHHLRALSALGHRVVGVDKEPAMIKIAKQYSPAIKHRFMLGDFATFHPDCTIDMALMTYYVFQRFATQESQRTVLANIAGWLSPRGLLVMELLNDTRNCDEFRDRSTATGMYKLDTGGEVVLESRAEIISSELKRLDMNFTIIEDQNPRRRVFHSHDSYMMYRATKDRMAALLSTSGFVVEEMFGDFSLNSKFDDYNSYRLIIVATNKVRHVSSSSRCRLEFNGREGARSAQEVMQAHPEPVVNSRRLHYIGNCDRCPEPGLET
jgi:SAM-dependent methyltransferase